MKINNNFNITLLITTAFLTLGCNKSADAPVPRNIQTPTTVVTPNEWLIPQESVFDGGPGKDGIPSIDDPKFSTAESINFLNSEDLILGVKVGDEIRGYPHPILDWHEIVNDRLGDVHLAITYCPLTGTGIAWDREIQGTVTTFGVSGLLFNTNLLPYDRESDSNWSQMLLTSVNGSHIGTEIKTYPLIETTWETWQSMFPKSMVLNTTTGFNRSYDVYPYGNYKTDHDQLLFPIANDDPRLPRKQRGLGVLIHKRAKFFGFDHFSKKLRVINDSFNGMDIVVAGSENLNFIVAYERKPVDSKLLRFTAEEIENQVIMKDDAGNQWNIFGEAVSGPLQGSSLKPVTGYIGYWFSWAAFFPEIQVL